jgi:hypothetical protein
MVVMIASATGVGGRSARTIVTMARIAMMTS